MSLVIVYDMSGGSFLERSKSPESLHLLYIIIDKVEWMDAHCERMARICHRWMGGRSLIGEGSPDRLWRAGLQK